jgi:hypothetical protein
LNRTEHENGLSDVFGAMLLIAVVGGAVALFGVAILSQPTPENIPSLTMGITLVNRTILITHDGGDTLQRTGMSILVDGVDRTNSFSPMNGGNWSGWAVGDTLMYQVPDGQSLPGSIEIVYTSGSSRDVVQSLRVPPTTTTP